MGYSKEIQGIWCGVEIPSWLRAFDVRTAPSECGLRAPWGETLWSAERAMVDLGLKAGYDSHATIPSGCHVYFDMRDCSEAELAKQIASAIADATRLHSEYEHAQVHRAAPGAGGSCYYMPVAISIGNYGWSVICDERTCVIRAFGG